MSFILPPLHIFVGLWHLCFDTISVSDYGVFRFSKIDGRTYKMRASVDLPPVLVLAFITWFPRSPLCPAASFTNKFSFHHGEPPHSSPLAATAQPTLFHPWLTAWVLFNGSILIYHGHRFLCRIRYRLNRINVHHTQQTSLFGKNVEIGNTTTHGI